MKVSKGMFLELDYTGKIKEGMFVFDTTILDVAKNNDLFEKDKVYTPVRLCVGRGHVIKGLDDSLEGKEIGEEYSVEIVPENAFGKRSAGLIKLVPLSQFKRSDINPTPGLNVQINDTVGVIKNVSGGRVLVDFNNPLSGKDVIYEVKILREIDNTKEKVECVLQNRLGLKPEGIDIVGEKVKIVVKFTLPPQVIELVSNEIKDCINEIKEVLWEEKKEEKPTDKNQITPKPSAESDKLSEGSQSTKETPKQKN